jgi:hypothetical protein
MTDEIPLNNVSKVIAETQDYIILGKSTKETEIRINFYASKYEDGRERVENGIRLAAYAIAMQSGQLPVPKYEPKETPHIKVES